MDLSCGQWQGSPTVGRTYSLLKRLTSTAAGLLPYPRSAHCIFNIINRKIIAAVGVHVDRGYWLAVWHIGSVVGDINKVTLPRAQSQPLHQPAKLKPSYDPQQTWPPPRLLLLTSTKWRHSTSLLACSHVCWGRSASQSMALNASAVLIGRKKSREYLIYVYEPSEYWDWWPSLGGYTTWIHNTPVISTQPSIPPASLNQVPA